MTPCDYARDRHRQFVLWRNLWTILLFVFGTAVVIFLVISILFFLNSENLKGALSTLGTIVTGAAIKWVKDRRDEALAEEKAAYADVVAQCSAADAQAVVTKAAKLRLFGLVR